MSRVGRIVGAARSGDRRLFESLSPLERRAAAVAHGTVYTIQRMVADRAPVLAAALAYRTLFSLIPVLVLALMVLRAFYQGEDIRPAINTLMDYFALDEIAIEGGTTGAEGVESAEGAKPTEVSAFINEFVQNAEQRLAQINYGAITAVGVAIFIYAALSLLIQIEHAFNTVCRAAAGRSFVVRLTNYWTMLTLGSLALFASFTIGAPYTERLQDLPGWLAWLRPIIQLLSTVGVAWLVLMFAYARMPNARVPLRAAAIGAAVAAVLWELSKTALTVFVGYAVAGQASIYGSLALLPVLMLWVYVTWLVVLAGLEIASSLQSLRAAGGSLGLDPSLGGPSLIDPALAVAVMVEVGGRFADGRPTEPDALSRATRLSEGQLEPILRRLIGEGLLHRVEGDDEDELRVTLARPAERVSVAEVLSAAASLTPEPADRELARVMEGMHRARDEALGGRTLADLLDRERGGDGAPGDEEGGA